jgi:hypothetical protein
LAPDPFTVKSNFLVTIFVILGAGGGYTLLLSLSELVGPNFEISLHRLPERSSSPNPSISVAVQPPRSGDSSTKTVEGHIVSATNQFLFAITMLLLTLAYYWQVYDPSDAVKPGCVDVFG